VKTIYIIPGLNKEKTEANAQWLETLQLQTAVLVEAMVKTLTTNVLCQREVAPLEATNELSQPVAIAPLQETLTEVLNLNGAKESDDSIRRTF